MQKQTLGKLGLVGLMLGSTFGCRNRIQPETLPANNVIFGRTMDVYEEDLQNSPEGLLDEFNSMPLEIAPCANDAPAIVEVELFDDLNNRDAPFDVQEVRSAQHPNVTYLQFTDNAGEFVDGEYWTMKVRSGCNNVIADSTRVVSVRYHTGSGPARLDDRLDNVEDEVFGYVVDDGKCDSALGENSANSPRDCYQMPTDLTDLLADTYTVIVDASGNEVSPMTVTAGSETVFRAQLHMHTELEYKVGAPSNLAITELGYTGADDCFRVVSVGQPQRTGEHHDMVTYESTFKMLKELGCAQNYELVHASFGLDIGNGDVNFNDSEEAMKSRRPSYQTTGYTAQINGN